MDPKYILGSSPGEKLSQKLKGAKEVPFSLMKSLLTGGMGSSLMLSHTKWFRSLSENQIAMKAQISGDELLRRKTMTKRHIVFTKAGKAINTRAFKLVNNQLLETDTLLRQPLSGKNTK